MYYADDIVNKLNTARSLVVFGAGVMAETVVHCLKEKPYQLQIRCCLVSTLEGNPACVSGIPVFLGNADPGRRSADRSEDLRSV